MLIGRMAISIEADQLMRYVVDFSTYTSRTLGSCWCLMHSGALVHGSVVCIFEDGYESLCLAKQV